MFVRVDISIQCVSNHHHQYLVQNALLDPFRSPADSLLVFFGPTNEKKCLNGPLLCVQHRNQFPIFTQPAVIMSLCLVISISVSFDEYNMIHSILRIIWTIVHRVVNHKSYSCMNVQLDLYFNMYSLHCCFVLWSKITRLARWIDRLKGIVALNKISPSSNFRKLLWKASNCLLIILCFYIPCSGPPGT